MLLSALMLVDTEPGEAFEKSQVKLMFAERQSEWTLSVTCSAKLIKQPAPSKPEYPQAPRPDPATSPDGR